MTRKQVRPFWPELPRGRADHDHIHYLLCEWAAWADLGADEAYKYNDARFMNGVVHYLAVALIIDLAPYAAKRGFDSEIFENINELNHALEFAFERGYWRELAEALGLCYAFSEPWWLSSEWAKKYADELHRRLKDISLYALEAVPDLEGKLEELSDLCENLNEQVEEQGQKLLTIQEKNKDRTKKATDTRKVNSTEPDILAAFKKMEAAGQNINARDVTGELSNTYKTTRNYISKLRAKYLQSKKM